MRPFLTLSCALWLACGGMQPVERVVVPLPTPIDEAAGPEAKAIPQAAWGRRTGRWEGPGPLARPEVLWTNKLAGPVVHPLTTDGQHVYAVAGGSVYAMDLAGLKRWTARIQASGPVVVTEAGLLVPRSDGRVAVLEADTGVVIKETDPAGPARTAPVLLGGVIAWTTSDGYFATSDGERQQIAAAALTGIAEDGGTIYVGAKDGALLAVDRSGVIWRAPLPGPPIAHPVIGDNSVYVVYTGSADITGGVVAVSRATGEIEWSGALGGNPGAAAALGDLLVVPGHNGELVGLDPTHGGVRWETPGYGAFTVQPALTKGTAYAGNADGRIHRVDLHDGGEAWAVELGATVTGDPVIVNGHLIVGLTDGRLVCLK